MRPWPLLVLMAACSPGERERVFVPSAAPVAAGSGRMTVRADGTHHLEECSSIIVMDAPGRIRMSDFGKAMEVAFQGGAKELQVLVDTPGGAGAVPLPLPVAMSGFGFYERGQIRLLWSPGEPDLPGARIRVGFDGDVQGMEGGSLDSFGVAVEEPVYGLVTPRHPSAPPPVRLEDARFILLRASPNDALKDVVLSLQSLNKRFSGKIVLEVLTK